MRLVRSGRWSTVGRMARRPSVRERTLTAAWAARRSVRNRSVTLEKSGGIGSMVVCGAQPARHPVQADVRHERAHVMVVRGSQPAEVRDSGPPLPEAAARAAPKGAASYFGRHEVCRSFGSLMKREGCKGLGFPKNFLQAGPSTLGNGAAAMVELLHAVRRRSFCEFGRRIGSPSPATPLTPKSQRRRVPLSIFYGYTRLN